MQYMVDDFTSRRCAGGACPAPRFSSFISSCRPTSRRALRSSSSRTGPHCAWAACPRGLPRVAAASPRREAAAPAAQADRRRGSSQAWQPLPSAGAPRWCAGPRAAWRCVSSCPSHRERDAAALERAEVAASPITVAASPAAAFGPPLHIRPGSAKFQNACAAFVFAKANT